MQWSGKVRNRDVTVQLLSPSFTYNGQRAAYFSVSAYGNTYPFSIGVDEEGNIEPVFTADLSSSCSTKDQCEWNKQMNWFMEEIDDLQLGPILDKAVNLALTIGRGKKKLADVPRQPYRNEVDRLFSYVISRPHGFKIVPSSMDEWSVVTDRDFRLDVTIKRSGRTGVYADVYVERPRLALGRNVDIGGIVTYKGLVPTEPVSDYNVVADMIAEALLGEAPHIVDTPYTDEERAICKGKQKHRAANVSIVTLWRDTDIEDDHAGIPEAMYFTELDKKPDSTYITVEVTSSLGLSGWYVAKPMDIPNGHVHLSNLSLVNLNVYDNKEGTLSFGKLSIPKAITVRPRATVVPAAALDEEHLVDLFSENTLVTVGHTYSIKGDLDMYVDIVDIQPPMKACLLRDEGQTDVDFTVDYSLYPVMKQLSPLGIPSSAYDTDESSEED